MKRTLLLASLLTMQSASATSIRIDLDLITPGVQNSISDAVEGQVVNFALVATNFSGNVHCYNGIGGDISSKGSMTASYNPLVQAGEITSLANEGYLLNFGAGTFPAFPGDTVNTVGITPLLGYTNNVGGIALMDQGSNLNGDNHVVSFTNSPVGPIPYVTIFTGSMTLTNVSGNTLDLFPSGIFNNPPTNTSPDGVQLPSSSPFSFQQNGDIMLHTEPHDFDQCQGIGSGDLFGATITGVPEPSATMMLCIAGFGVILRRSR